jgi:hypothetical protein
VNFALSTKYRGRRSRGEAPTVDRRTGTFQGVTRYAVDPDNAERLWDLSTAMLANA